jgi:acyl transferase domain-containing protein
MLDAYGVYFREHSAGDARQLDLLAHTLSARRSVMTWRSFDVVDEDTCELSLLSSSPSAVGTRIIRSTVGGGGGKLAFVFTGQGAQYVGMGRELLRYAIFRKSLKRSDEVLKGLGCGWSVFGKFVSSLQWHPTAPSSSSIFSLT